MLTSDDSLFSFEKLRVWQEARMLTKQVYGLCCNFPDYEKYALGSQIRRAMISVTSNIAEGSGRNSVKEKIHFLEIAYGSMAEVYSQLVVAVDLGYIDKEEVEHLKPSFAFTLKLMKGLKYKFAEE